MRLRQISIFLLCAATALATVSCDLFTKADPRVATPTFNPSGGAYESGTAITIFCSTPGASIYYSTDGSAPTIAYTGPIELRQESYTLKAIATRLEWRDSKLAETSFNIGRLPKPQFSLLSGANDYPVILGINCDFPGVTIRYTTDSSEPHSASTLYNTPINISSITTIKAKAFKPGWLESLTATITPVPQSFTFEEGGTFHNGTSNVTLSSFLIGKYEVTQAEYQAVMGTNPSYFSGNPNRPVECVSWFNAIEYCNRRSMQEGLTPCYSYSTYGTNPSNWPAGWNTTSANHTNVSCNWSVDGYRLPTEMEWMYAAKGGNQSQGYTYSGSNTIGNVAWYYNNSNIGDGQGRRTHDVGLKDPNELGTYDMSGNVWEWVWDIYGNYPSGNQTDPTGPTSGSNRVWRGGSWFDYANLCTVSNRGGSVATVTDSYIGFRIIRVSP